LVAAEGMPCHAIIHSSWSICWDSSGRPIVPFSPAREPLSLTKTITPNGWLTKSRSKFAKSRRLLFCFRAFFFFFCDCRVQIVPVCSEPCACGKRGRVSSVKLTLTEDARKALAGVYAQLDPAARNALLALRGLKPRRIISKELEGTFVKVLEER